MPDLNELHETFFPSNGIDKTASAPPATTPSGADELARALGITKAASATPTPENEMKSLSEIYNGLVDMEKQASAPAARNAQLEKKAEVLARVSLRKEAAIQKTAAEYDAAGRIMARGFVDEFMGCMDKIANEGMQSYVAGQVPHDGDLANTNAPIPTTGPMTANADLEAGAQNSTVEGVKNQLGVTASGLGGGEVGKIMTVRDQLGQPALATSTNLGG